MFSDGERRYGSKSDIIVDIWSLFGCVWYLVVFGAFLGLSNGL